jgi:citrate synthase
MNEGQFLDQHAELIKHPRVITPAEYQKYNVKRGLRNDDGTGVVVGLTEIGDVHGYILDENEKIPVEGRLRYRGIDITDIVANFQKEQRFGFEEVVYLLLFGRLPNRQELDDFTMLIGGRRTMPPGYWEDIILRSPSPDIMNKLGRAVLGTYSYDGNPEENSIRNVLRQSIELIARFPAMVAYSFQAKRRFYNSESLIIHAQKPEMSSAENFLHMIRPSGEYTALEAELLDLALVLHAEHGGGNNSAFTVHVVTSAYTDTYSAIAAAVGSLKGDRHGGASNRVREMVNNIKQNVKDWENRREVLDYLKKILQGQAHDGSGLIYGMGHAIYTLSDPRAELLKSKATALADSLGEDARREFALYELIRELSPRAFADVKQNEKVISPNVDFYSGFVYSLLGIPDELFTPIFAVSRIAGWCSHRLEELALGSRIYRPAYKNVLGGRPFIPIDERQ